MRVEKGGNNLKQDPKPKEMKVITRKDRKNSPEVSSKRRRSGRKLDNDQESFFQNKDRMF